MLHNLGNFSRRFRGTESRALGREVPLRQAAGTATSDQSGPEAKLLAQERDEALVSRFAMLPEHYREVVLWRNYERLSFDEIGTLSHRSEEAARKLWTRAIKSLQELLETPDGSAAPS